jgi:hypothetical protein
MSEIIYVFHSLSIFLAGGSMGSASWWDQGTGDIAKVP